MNEDFSPLAAIPITFLPVILEYCIRYLVVGFRRVISEAAFYFGLYPDAARKSSISIGE
nr:MAG TPA: hypothetical protein [Bacteriophage sp.]